ncbi:anti-sigma factor [Antrihabitans sp. YC2-6]|uniref:anti-sigma factor family protein n=1 Tax=Antrihabitans sp. YC2-6 TaxID=2799498 RepID=UPI0018F44B1E|nr:zf-HC2 domain-containing protein [Antrihabitans sp. YC2-6]MBJ8345392.1 zf-HC2 domain-containing protein [Antrihabitans sp. YC2-6]
MRDDEIRCRQVVEMVTDYLDDELPPAVRRAFEQHLLECVHCTEYLGEISATIALLRRAGHDDRQQ